MNWRFLLRDAEATRFFGDGDVTASRRVCREWRAILRFRARALVWWSERVYRTLDTNPDIHTIRLSETRLGGRDALLLGTAIGEALPRLRALSIRHPGWRRVHASHVIRGLARARARGICLDSLSMDGCGLVDDDVAALMDAVGHVPDLALLHNPMTIRGIERAARTGRPFREFAAGTTWWVDPDQIVDDAMLQPIAAHAISETTTVSFMLAGCMLQSIRAVAERFEKCQVLENVVLHDNGLVPEVMEDLVGRIPDTVTRLDLSSNYPGAALLTRLPERLVSLEIQDCAVDDLVVMAMKPFVCLRYLDVSGNLLTDNGARDLMAKLPRSTLEHVDLACNVLEEPTFFVQGLGAFSVLEYLGLRSNSIPASLLDRIVHRNPSVSIDVRRNLNAHR